MTTWRRREANGIRALIPQYASTDTSAMTLRGEYSAFYARLIERINILVKMIAPAVGKHC